VINYFNLFSNVLRTSNPSSVFNQAANAEYGCSSNGTVNSFLPLLAHVNFLLSLDNLIISASTALIPTFLS